MKRLGSVPALAAAGLICGLPIGHGALAATQDSAADAGTLEEVIVTAERRSVDLQKVAVAVTAIDGADLEQRGVDSVAEALQNVPGVVVQGITDGPSQQSVQGAGGPPNISIRGLGTSAVNTAGSVAIYEDGVLLQGGGSNFYDMSRVEVLRGPQGTLYGRGATAGAVNFITNDPQQDFEASGKVTFGSFNLVGTQGMVNIPLTDTLAIRAAYNQARHDGYFNNGWSSEDDVGARVKALFKPGDDFSLLLGYTDYRSNGSGPGQVPLATNAEPSDWTTDLAGGASDVIGYRKVYTDVEANLGFARLTYLGSYQTTHSDWAAQGSFAYLDITQPINQTWTNELRLASSTDSRLTWQAGVYAYQNRLETAYQPGPAPTAGGVFTPFFIYAQRFHPRSLGLFGEATFAFTDQTRATLGLRETRDHVDVAFAAGVGAAFTRSSTDINHFDWKARVEHDLASNNLLYGSITTGYRPGTYTNNILNRNETVHAYEVGSKNQVGNTMTLNGAVFYYDYGGFQEPYSIPNPAHPTYGGVGVTVVVPARFYGAELEATIKLSANDKLTLSPTWLHATYTSNITVISPFDGSVYANVQSDGGAVPTAPKFGVSGSYEHDFVFSNGSALKWEADAHYQTSQLTDYDTSNYPSTNPVFQQGAYAIANSALTYTGSSGKYSLSAYGRNLFNKIYKVTVYNPQPPYVFVDDPRTFGVSLAVKL